MVDSYSIDTGGPVEVSVPRTIVNAGATNESGSAMFITEPRWPPGVLTLMASGWRPVDDLVSRCAGICFTEDGEVVLVAAKPGAWELPGGRIEPEETPEAALVREVAEEACAEVLDYQYICCQHVWLAQQPEAYQYQTWWWAKVRLGPWRPKSNSADDKMVERITVAPGAFLAMLAWRDVTKAARLLAEACEVERDRVAAEG